VDGDALVERLVAWVAGRPDVEAAVIVGSRARRDHPADPWSDVDLVLVTDHPERFLDDATWLAELGRPILSYRERTAVGGERERRVLFEGGQDLDVAVLRPAALAAPRPELAAVAARGARVLLDRSDVLGPVLAAAPAARAARGPALPGQEELDELVSDALHHLLLAARKLARGELWIARATLGGHLPALLLRLLEWHAVAAGPTDVWHGGRFLEQWADPRFLARLPATDARYDAPELRRAVAAMHDLVRDVGLETADRLGLTYPVDADDGVRALLASSLTVA
jgi:aminoglycoside 6-adenylyltransferase